MSNLIHLDKLIGTVKTDTYFTSLNSIKYYAGLIWGPSFRIIDDFTSHGKDHSDRIAQNILKLMKEDSYLLNHFGSTINMCIFLLH